LKTLAYVKRFFNFVLDTRTTYFSINRIKNLYIMHITQWRSLSLFSNLSSVNIYR